jgi:type II restriction enzyme
MSHNKILHEITLEAVSGGVPMRRDWLRNSGHFRWGNLAKMSSGERLKAIDDMLTEGN